MPLQAFALVVFTVYLQCQIWMFSAIKTSNSKINCHLRPYFDVFQALIHTLIIFNFYHEVIQVNTAILPGEKSNSGF